jgi:nucleoside-diphosphate-sugar epimerase
MVSDCAEYRVLITGVSGFIGSHVAAACRKRGWHVIGCGRRVATSAPVTEYITCSSISAVFAANAIGRPPDAVIHLAWPTDPKTYLHSTDNINALFDSIALIRSALQIDCRRFVIAGTCAEYQQGACTPISEQHTIEPATLYASCKHALHLVARSLCDPGDATLCWGRIFHLFGPGENRERLIPALAATLTRGDVFSAGSGTQLRDFLRVEDVADALAMLAAPSTPNGAYNICSGNETRLSSVMARVAAITGNCEKLRMGERADRKWEPQYLVGSNTRLKSIGWKQTFDLDTGLSEYVRWLDACRSC